MFQADKTYKAWKELDRRWPAVVQLRLSKGEGKPEQTTGPEKSLLALLLLYATQ